MKTTYELNEVLYLPHKITTIELDKEGNVVYWVDPLYEKSDDWLEIQMIKEKSLEKVKVFSEPYKKDMFQEGEQ